MASAITELETNLQAMSALKPPGVSGTRITALTSLCVANVQSESVLIQKIYTHFKKTDGDHKLGVLYVVDSVTRKWLDQAKAQGQAVDGSARDGTYAAGVHRVTELMPVLMSDLIQSAPEMQKEKISKLLDIWEKGQTFPQPLIESFRTKLATAPAPVKSTTPVGSPPPGLLASLGVNPNTVPGQSHPGAAVPFPGRAPSTAPAAPAAPAAPGPSAQQPAQNSNAIMEALANIARQNISAPSSQPAPQAQAAPPPAAAPAPARPSVPYNNASLSGLLSSLAQSQASASNPPPTSYASQPSAAPPAHSPAPNMPYAFPPQGSAPQTQAQGSMPAYGQGQGQANSYSAPPPVQPPAPASNLNADTQQQVLLIKTLVDQGVPYDKIPAIIQSIQAGNAASQPSAPSSTPSSQQQSYSVGEAWGSQGAHPSAHGSRDTYGYNDHARNSDRQQRRSRSQSPARRWDTRDSPRGSRDEYGGRRFEDRDDRGGGRGGRRPDFRQRSPAGRRGRSPSPAQFGSQEGQEKWVEYDKSLPNGHIRVYSRTLFVGGVTCSEQELRSIFNQHGAIQTCIVNKDKRHAFVKMLTRRDAVAAKEAMEYPQGANGIHLRTRWGVGYGPRHCSDYSTGISVIPISALTEADRKWMLTAPVGGSGGRPIESGMVVEEPDIEIGAGVSSKAISRRMQTDKSGNHGPKSSQTGGSSGHGSSHGGDGHGGASEQRWRHGKGSGNAGFGGNGGGGGSGSRGRDDNQASGANAQPLPEQFPFGIGTMANGMPNFPPGFAFPAPDGQTNGH